MNEFMKVADELAKENVITNNGGPFGAVVVKNGVIVGKGNNHVVANNDPTAHAEVMAIRNACENLKTFNLEGCELYTSCYPCPMCLSATIWSNIKTVYYGNTKEDAENIGFRDNHIYKYINSIDTENEDKNTLNVIQMNREETIDAFNKYKSKTENKTMY